MISKNKKAGFAGRAAALLIFLHTLIFAISVPIINSHISTALASSMGIIIRASVWVYASMILGIIGFLLATKYKRIIIGEEN
jgi:hypothetical protein